MARRASEAAGVKRQVIGVSRFSNPALRPALEARGIPTIRGDLLDPEFVASLPEVPNVVFMAGRKFGATGNESLTWAMNTHLPAIVAERFCRSRIVVFSTGNVYPLVPVDSGGSKETDPPGPIGEYAMSCLGRERVFEHFSRTLGIPVAIVRLYYAHELRYGVLVDLAHKVLAGEEIDVSMGYVNVIWQADANAMILATLTDAASPPLVINVVGPQRLSVREVSGELGRLMGREPKLAGSEAPDALLGNGEEAVRRYGRPRVSPEQLIRWVADWVQQGGESLAKPTHFEVRDGKF